MLSGRGLFYGAVNARGQKQIFTEADWHARCTQAKSWGMAYVHPKVADGGYFWYDDAELHMLADVARAEGLMCLPYNYCYGNKFGALVHEAQMTAHIGSIFGAVCPDIEVEWDNQHQWAIEFGQIVRSTFHGGVYPTLFPNPDSHPSPYAELEKWCDGWMPMVYFNEWRFGGHDSTASEAAAYCYPQWLALDAHLKSQGIQPKPILPLISLDKRLDNTPLPQQEVSEWLRGMQYYGYCGFWYDGVYAPYAETVLKAPLPHLRSASPATLPSKPAEHQPTVLVPVVKAPTPPPQPAATTTLAELEAKDHPNDVDGEVRTLTDAELTALWQRNAPVPWERNDPVCRLWAAYVLAGRGIGSPSAASRIPLTLGEELTALVPLDSGHELVYFPKTKAVVLMAEPKVSGGGAPDPLTPPPLPAAGAEETIPEITASVSNA